MKPPRGHRCGRPGTGQGAAIHIRGVLLTSKAAWKPNKLKTQHNKPTLTNKQTEKPNLNPLKEAGLSNLSIEKCEELLALHSQELAAKELAQLVVLRRVNFME